MIWGQDNSAGEKDFEFFQVFDDLRPRHFCRRNNLWIFSVIDDLRPRQYCRRKRLWIIPGYWWFAAKTNLQVKKSLKFSRLLMICGPDNFAGETIFEFFRLLMICGQNDFAGGKTLNISRLLMIWGQDNSAGEKDFEYFQVVDDLRLRELCRRKIVGIFPGCWWFAAKTILQVKKSLNIFGVSMIWG